MLCLRYCTLLYYPNMFLGIILSSSAVQVTMQYNLCNEPWLKFSIGTIADRGLKASQWTGSRLSSDVLYVETHRWCSQPKPNLTLIQKVLR